MKFIKGCIIAVAGLLQSCFNSDDHIFDETNAVDIKIEATLSTSITSNSQVIKADTFNINDTIYFLTSIKPNKIIKIQDYYWLMDGKYCSSEYNFKKQISEPGYHKFNFVLKDYFGDMHYDSLEVWIAANPILNDTAYTPAEGTQAIDPFESIYFTWSAKTEGIKLGHYYKFTLSEQNFANENSTFTTIDTILDEPHFIYHHKLNAFKKYNWTVQAFNEYKLPSEEIIESFFYTKGNVGNGSLQASINIGNAIAIPLHVSLQSKSKKSNTLHYNFTISNSNNEISLGAVPADKYSLTIKSDYPDFKEVQKDVAIHESFITLIKNIKVLDSIAPTITAISGKDTLDFADTLQFIVKDGGGALATQHINVHLENENISDKTYKDSILKVVLKETDKSWAYRILTISTLDGSQNTSTKSFYIAPSTFWFNTNNDTTITNKQTIDLFIVDNNPFGFKIDSLKFFNITENRTIISVQSKENNSFTATLEANLFDKEQTIQSIVIYKNGMRQSKKWKLYVKGSTKEEE